MYTHILKAERLVVQKDEPKKKRKYKFVAKFPAEKLTGWQEVVMDIDKVRASFEATRSPKE